MPRERAHHGPGDQVREGDLEGGLRRLMGVLDAFGIPYTGSDVLGSALSMDKIRTKQVWLSLGLPTPRYARLARNSDVAKAARELGLPVIVKPACEGSSVGVTRVFKEEDLKQAVDLAARYQGEMLMEQLIVGDELTVAILGDTALPSIRIVPAGEYYDYHAKYKAEDTQYICPGLQGAAEDEIRALALEAFRTAGCYGWGRVDVMRDRASGKFYLLEVNTAPGMTSHSLVPKSAKQFGIDFDELVWRVLETSLPHAGQGAPRS
jgi:D-alanine-D-alanine ligase